jgi:hypothetical protein
VKKMAKQKIKRKVTLDGELMFPSDYVSAPELKGRDVTVTITSVTMEPLQMAGGGRKNKPILRFQGTAKKMVCNQVNADTISQLHGAKAEKWVGKKITLYPTRCLAFGDMVECIRVRETIPAGSVPAVPKPDQNASPGNSEEGGNPLTDSAADQVFSDDPLEIERQNEITALEADIQTATRPPHITKVMAAITDKEELLGTPEANRLRGLARGKGEGFTRQQAGEVF